MSSHSTRGVPPLSATEVCDTVTGYNNNTDDANTDHQWKSVLLETRCPRASKAVHNNAITYAVDMVRSEAARVDGRLTEDFSAILKGGCIYLENFLCQSDDFTLFDKLKKELVAHSGESLDKNGLINWSKHQVYENPDSISDVFNAIIAMIAEYFDIEVYATRLNYYRDGSQWKPYHHDSHAYGDKSLREDFTAGVTLGSTRSLSFLHEPSKHTFSFPQKNGDVFAFNTDVNKRFMHGVPRATTTGDNGDRFSIIAWGRRRSINERNGGKIDIIKQLGMGTETPKTYDDAITAAHKLVSCHVVKNRISPSQALPSSTVGIAAIGSESNENVTGGTLANNDSDKTRETVVDHKAKRPKRRLQ